ncbi:PTS sugar transporter subunit IIC, partial [Listeria monocytogenes]|nr:PTS sugar transporter subunit IIC [Listeria monocytogenes]
INTEFLDSRGLLIAIFAALISVELIALYIRKNITIRIKVLPAGIATTFEAIIQLVVLLFRAVGLSILMKSVTSGHII